MKYILENFFFNLDQVFQHVIGIPMGSDQPLFM